MLAVLQIFFLQGLCRNLVEAHLARKYQMQISWLPRREWVCARREMVPFLERTGRECAQLPYAVKRHLFLWNFKAHLLKSSEMKDMK